VNRKFDSQVEGLDHFPVDQRPPVAVLHYAFQTMVACGMLMVFFSVVYLLARIKWKKWLEQKWLYTLYALGIPIGFLAVEAGWTVTEVGRQPWIIQGIMRTSEAVTPMPGVQFSFYAFTAVYVSLTLMVIFMLYRQIKLVSFTDHESKLTDIITPN
jgi:cytochrome d ubiquinol oxidase subunit I